jgi:fucose permease
LSHLYPSQRGRLFGYYDMMWAVGATAGPLFVAGAVAAGNWRLAYYGLGVAFVPVLALMLLLPTPSIAGGDEPLDLAELRRIVRRPEVLAMAVGLFLSTGFEGGLFTWLPYYARAELPGGWAELTLTAMLVAYVPGRFVCSVLSERLGPLTLLVGVLGLLIPAFAFTFFVAGGLAVLAGVVAIGLLISGVFPTMMAYATDAVPEHSGPVNALASGMGSVGVGSVPAVMGVFVGRSGAKAAMGLLLVPVVGGLLQLGFGIGVPPWLLFPVLAIVAIDTVAVGISLRSASHPPGGRTR